MITQIRKGNEILEVNLPDTSVILSPANLPQDMDEAEIVKKALLSPIGSKRLNQIVHPAEKIVIITSDITRPMPTDRVMDPLMEELVSAGVELLPQAARPRHMAPASKNASIFFMFKPRFLKV